ncbi:hypothetical protein HDU89_000946 [Geranomyces variabilis]|nr:hypothetical protein HDU89_000946 [Geranomyces variabilis]
MFGVPSFYEGRGIINFEHRDKFIARGGLKVLKTAELERMDTSDLVIVNAHKFGTNSGVDLDKIPVNFDLIIVDEAHHYPAATWKRIVDKFSNSKRLFLTATPKNKGEDILPNQSKHLCYNLSRKEAEDVGAIRPLLFCEVGKYADGPEEMYQVVGRKLYDVLQLHDQEHPEVKHQAMVLTHLKEEATKFASFICDRTRDQHFAQAHHADSPANSLKDFKSGKTRVLAVCGKLIEGFDRKEVSIVVILRNVHPTSRVLFAQFVGRAVRRMGNGDPTKAVVISHCRYAQRENFYNMDALAEVDPDDDEGN